MNVTASADFGIEEMNEACDHIREKSNSDVDLIFGLVFDEKTKDFVKITVVATGIENYIDKRALDIISENPICPRWRKISTYQLLSEEKKGLPDEKLTKQYSDNFGPAFVKERQVHPPGIDPKPSIS